MKDKVSKFKITKIQNEEQADEILQKNPGSFLLQFDEKEHKCYFECKRFNLKETWEYSDGEEQLMLDRATEIVNQYIKRAIKFNLLYLTIMMLFIGTGLCSAYMLFQEDISLGVKMLLQTLFIIAITIKPFCKWMTSATVGVLAFIVSWSCFYEHEYLLGFLYMFIGSMDILREK